MINQHDIADFNLSDGLTPHQVKKLNYNFQNVFADIRSLTDKAKRPVESLRIGTVTMVASDEPASVENSGSRNNVVLDFRIPTGVEPKITDAQVDSVLAGDAPTGNRVLSLTGLSRFWAGVKQYVDDAASSLGAFVRKVGDQMTGDLEFPFTPDYGTTPPTSLFSPGVVFTDGSGKVVSRIQGEHKQDGKMGVRIHGPVRYDSQGNRVDEEYLDIEGTATGTQNTAHLRSRGGSRFIARARYSGGLSGFTAIIDSLSKEAFYGLDGTGEVLLGNGSSDISLSSSPANAVLAAPNGSAGPVVARSLVAADIPNLPASKITSGTLALARGGTASDNTARAINTVFAGPSSGSAGNASWRKLADADIPSLNASKIDAGTFNINRIPTITPAKGGTGRTVAALSSKTIFSGLNVASGGSMGTNADVFDYRFFMATLASGCYCYGYRTGSTSSAGSIFLVGGKDSGGGARVILAQIAVATNGKCTYTAGGEHSVGSGTASSTGRNITGLYGLY